MEIEHVIVLLLENRSFDHMLGFLNHPDPQFPQIHAGQYSNPYPDHSPVDVDNNAGYILPVGPGHHFDDIQVQMKNGNKGFVENYLNKITKKREDASKKLKWLKTQLSRDKRKVKDFAGGRSIVDSAARKRAIKARIRINTRKIKELTDFLKRTKSEINAGRVMRCFSEEKIPVLSTLAREFCVFTNWHASVPGMTWPNRAYAISSSSDGEVDIVGRLYWNKTIFEDLSAKDKSWAIYHDGPSHTWAYPKVWFNNKQHYRNLKSLFEDISDPDYDLPGFCFVEPNHGLKFGPLYRSKAEQSNSQHPGNNLNDIRDFVEGEQLVANIYNALKQNPKRFEKTLFLITYDEHGGLFDNVTPPEAPAPGDKVHTKFNFDSLGIRVPAVLVSPWIRKGTINNDVRDHSAIPKTIRRLFIKNNLYLSEREKWVLPFHAVCDLKNPRRGDRLPDVKPVEMEQALSMEGISRKTLERADKNELQQSKLYLRDLEEFEKSLIGLSAVVEKAIEDPNIDAPEKVKWSKTAVEEIDTRFTNDNDLGHYVESVSSLVRNQ